MNAASAQPSRFGQLAARLNGLPRAKRELLIFGALLLAGLFLIPILIYITGSIMLGAYGNGGFGAFMKDLFTGLAHGTAPVWIMVLGPYVLLTLLRATLFIFRRLQD